MKRQLLSLTLRFENAAYLSKRDFTIWVQSKTDILTHAQVDCVGTSLLTTLSTPHSRGVIWPLECYYILGLLRFFGSSLFFSFDIECL